jgi:hypothetical protein
MSMDAANGARVDSCGSYASASWKARSPNMSLWSGGLSRDEIDELCVADLMHRIVMLIIDDATRDKPDLSGPSLGQLDDVWDYMSRRSWKAQEYRALGYMRRYGGGALIAIVDDGLPLSEEINLSKIRSVVSFADLDKYNVIPGPPSSDLRPAWWGPRWGRPSYYNVTSSYPGSGDYDLRGSTIVHPSRVIPYKHRRDLNDRMSRRFAGWAGWGPGAVEAVVEAYLARVKGIARLNGIINSFGFDIWQNANLHDVLEGSDGWRKLQNWLNWFKTCRDATEDGVPVVCVGPENKLLPQNRTVTGLRDLIVEQRQFLLDSVVYPAVVLYGETASGLGSGAAEGEWQTYYQIVESFREEQAWPGIKHAALLCMAAKDGPTAGRVDFDIVAAWPSLAEENEGQISENRLRNAQAREIEIASLGLDPADALRLDNSLEKVMPGIQSDAENGSIVLTGGAGVPQPAPMPSASPAAAGAPLAGEETADAATGPLGALAGASAPPAPSSEIPTDLIPEPQARRLLRCGRQAFLKKIAAGDLHPWQLGVSRLYSMAELTEVARGGRARGEADESGEGEERIDGARWDAAEIGEHAVTVIPIGGLKGFTRRELDDGAIQVLAHRRGAVVLQSLRFPADLFTGDDVREWIRERGIRGAVTLAR